MYYTILEAKKAVYLFKTKKQLAAAARWLTALDPAAKHYKTAEGKRAIKKQYGAGYNYYDPQEAAPIADFYLPHPDKPFLLKAFLSN